MACSLCSFLGSSSAFNCASLLVIACPWRQTFFALAADQPCLLRQTLQLEPMGIATPQHMTCGPKPPCHLLLKHLWAVTLVATPLTMALNRGITQPPQALSHRAATTHHSAHRGKLLPQEYHLLGLTLSPYLRLDSLSTSHRLTHRGNGQLKAVLGHHPPITLNN